MNFPLLSNYLKPGGYLPSLLAILIFLFVSFTGYAQTGILQKRISLELGPTTVEEALAALERETGYEILYSSNLIHAGRKVQVSYRNTSVMQILRDILGEAAKSIQVAGRQIKIQPSAGKGDIVGTVQTSNGRPAGYVTVAVKGLRSTRTNDQGRFTLENMEAGTYILTVSYVGLQTRQQEVSVSAGATVSVSFTLEEDAQTLQEVIVTGEGLNKFADKETGYVARMPLGDLENPQVYHVVTKELLAEQLNTSINDALANASGTVVMNSPAGGIHVSFRGFTGSFVSARNGLQTASVRSSLDPVNLERIEVLKGPSGTLFQGLASYGGVVNLVTKKPYETRGGSIGYSFGSFGLSRTTIDYNTPLSSDSSILFRLNAALHREGSFREAGHNNTYTIAPSFRYKASDRLDFLVDMELYRFDQTRTGSLDFGPYKLASEIPLQEVALFADDVNAEGTNVKSFLQANYRLFPNWLSSTNMAIINEQLDNSYQPHYVFNSTGDSIYRNLHLYGPIINKYINLQQNFTGDFRIGGLRNRLLVGIDYNQNTNIRNDKGRGLVIDTMAVASPTKLYRRQIEAAFTATGSVITSSFTESVRYGGYVSNVLNVTGQLIAMLSLRVDRFERKGDNAWGQTALSPKLGLVYQPVKDRVAVFANLLDGFNNENTAVREDGTLVNLDPEHATQYEGGVKLRAAGGKISATLSYYHIKVHNAVLYDDQDFFLSQDGLQVSKGADVEVIVNPAPGLHILAGYAYNDNRYIRASSFQGRYATGIPQNVGNFWVSYKFHPGSALKNFGIGLGGNFVDESFRDGANTAINPSYSLFSGTVYYESDKWRLGLKMNNMADTKYYSNRGLLQNPRHIVTNVSFNF